MLQFRKFRNKKNTKEVRVKQPPLPPAAILSRTHLRRCRLRTHTYTHTRARMSQVIQVNDGKNIYFLKNSVVYWYAYAVYMRLLL